MNRVNVNVLEVWVDGKRMKALMFDRNEVPFHAWKTIWVQAIKQLFEQSQSHRPVYEYSYSQYSYTSGTSSSTTNNTWYTNSTNFF